MKMQNRYKRAIATALCALMLLTLNGAALAADVFEWDLDITGNNNISFAYESGAIQSLFEFDDVMPGDTATAEFSINNESSSVAYDVFLHAQPTPGQANEDAALKFLNQLQLSIYEGSTLINTARLAGGDDWPVAPDGLSEPDATRPTERFIHLGRIFAGGALDFTADLTWPVAEGADSNAYQGAEGKIDWIIGVTPYTHTPPDDDDDDPFIPLWPPIITTNGEPIPLGTPTTSDNTNILYWCILLVALVLALMLLIVLKRRRKPN